MSQLTAFLNPTKPFKDLKAVFGEKKKNPTAPLNPKQLAETLLTDPKTRKSLLAP